MRNKFSLTALYTGGLFCKQIGMKARSKARLLAVQFLYQLDVDFDRDLEEALADFWTQQQEKPSNSVVVFANTLVRGVHSHWEELNALIASHAENWIFERISPVDRCILRLAAHEIRHRDDIPPVVSINEAVEIAKILGTDDSPKFVNGILDKIMRETLRPARSSAPSK